jgi:hypothetical protein
MVLYSARLMPMLCAEISLSRIATMARPIGLRSRLADTHNTRISTAREV